MLLFDSFFWNAISVTLNYFAGSIATLGEMTAVQNTSLRSSTHLFAFQPGPFT